MQLPFNFDLQAFENALGYGESSNSYNAVGHYAIPAYGKYQFLESRLIDLSAKYDLNYVSVQNFLNNPSLQDLYFAYHVYDILQYIIDHNLSAYIGQTITGANKYPYTTKINIYGLVAGAHLGGNGGLNNFLTNGYDAQDANGTHISDYIAKYSNALSSDKKKITS